ncbi:GNAT family N-acetyltransferase [Bacillus infantis]|uniref:GNAT family N-acetyltransferase n=1 Tax=Bacillus infantis TaxID=324767 RepID=A0A5D4SF06_9BACI|nr:GNAT family N-acetyltransferase [Bacillus infantis]TYS60562.1 GNAT family N-acetyltransferase [Bacillus infantis]
MLVLEEHLKIDKGRCSLLKIDIIPEIVELFELQEENNMVLNFNGEWFTSKNKFGNYYFGENLFTDIFEVYLNIYIDVLQKDDLNHLIREVTEALNERFFYFNVQHINLKISYIDTINHHLTNPPLNAVLDDYYVNYFNISKKVTINTNFQYDVENFLVKDSASEHADEIINCLKRAHLTGVPAKLQKLINVNSYLTKIESYYYEQFETNENYLSMIIVDKNNKFCGHATAEVTGNRSQLIDTFVLEDYRHGNLGRILYSYLENELYRKGIREISGTVIPNTDTNILSNLLKVGWNVTSSVYGKII